MVKLWLSVSKEKDLVTYIEKMNVSYKRFFENGSWYLYFVSLILILISVYYLNLDVRRKNLLLQRRREIRRENERPPPKRRPGVAIKDHEIYRIVFGKVQEYLDPAHLDKYKLHLSKTGEIIGITNKSSAIASLNKIDNSNENIAPLAAAINHRLVENIKN